MKDEIHNSQFIIQKRVLILLFALIVLSGCVRIKEEIAFYPPTEEKEILVGILIPYESRYKVLGEDMRDGILLGLNGIRSNIYDTEADPIQAIKVSKKAILEDGVMGIIGPLLSSTAIPVASIAQSMGVVMLSPMATEQRLPSIGRYIYRLYSPSDVQEIVLARYIMEEVETENIVVLAPDDSHGKWLVKGFQDEIEKLGGAISRIFYYPPGVADLREIMLELKELRPDALFVPAYEADISAIAPQFVYYEVLTPSTVILGLREWGYPGVRREYRDYLDKVIFTSVQDLDYQELEESFAHRYGRNLTKASIMGYAAGRLFALAVQDGVDGRDELLFWLENNDTIQPLPGISLSRENLADYVRIYSMRDGRVEVLR
ncbi:penicillin-binding protein activator [candidate division WOR-3 bacterium]|nr:penicillin-binding protein activator [candidate division WOR-3 bacterium]